MNEAIYFIQQVGFPIFVAVVLLLRVETMHVESIRAIHALTAAVQSLCLLVGDKALRI